MVTLDLAEDMELENVKALCEYDLKIPASKMVISANGQALTDDKKSLASSGLKRWYHVPADVFSETSDLFLVFLYHSLFFSGDVVLVSMSGPAPSARPAPTATGQTPSKMPKIDFSRFVLSILYFHPSIDWLIVCLIDQLYEWMIDWLIGGLIDPLMDRLIDWFDSIRVPGASGASTSRQDTSSRPPAGASAELSQAQQFLEATRREIEADPEAMERLGKSSPELLDLVMKNDAAGLLEFSKKQRLEQARKLQVLYTNPDSLEAQQLIQEQIRAQAIQVCRIIRSHSSGSIDWLID